MIATPHGEELALRGGSAKQELAAKIERLRALPALIRAARWESFWQRSIWNRFESLENIAECKRLGIGYLDCALPEHYAPEGMYIDPRMQAWGKRLLRERELIWEYESLKDEVAAEQHKLQRSRLLHFLNHAMVVEYVMLIVTKFGAIPLTSVPVILRNYRQMPVM